jgi:hypothetical protein
LKKELISKPIQQSDATSTPVSESIRDKQTASREQHRKQQPLAGRKNKGIDFATRNRPQNHDPREVFPGLRGEYRI